MTEDDQQVKGTTGGTQLGSVPLILYLDKVDAYIESQRDMLARELEMWRVEHEKERDSWRKAHERVHEVEQGAIHISDNRMNERLESMNEFRRQIELMLSTYVTRELLDATMHAAESAMNRVDRENQRRFDELNRGVVEMNRQWANAQGRFTAYGAAISLFIIILNMALGIIFAVYV